MERLADRAGSNWLGRLVSSLVEVAFPPVCGNCRRLGSLICDDCRGAMAEVPQPVCPCCGRGQTAHESTCEVCAHHALSLRQVRAALLYAEPTTTLIHQMKYEGYFALAQPLGRIMVERWPAWSMSVDLIVPVPLHEKRERRRGYNQANLLAQHLAAGVGLPVESRALIRTRHTRPQVELGPQERAENVRDAFAADERHVAGRHVLLVDDVFTTGATMVSAAGALLGGGAAAVSAYCLSRVR